MNPADAELVDLPAFLRHLRGERTTAMLVHGAPLCGKTCFARQLAHKTGATYLDMLEMLSRRPDLSAQIDQFDPSTLRLLLLEQVKSTPTDILLVDELDFLFPLWAGDLPPFQEMVRALANPGRAVAFAFFVQSRPEWENWNLQTAGHQSRIIPFENLKSI